MASTQTGQKGAVLGEKFRPALTKNRWRICRRSYVFTRSYAWWAQCACALIGEFRGVPDQQNRTVTVIVTCARGGEVAAENVGLLDTIVGEEAVGRLRVRPVLARERYAAAR